MDVQQAREARKKQEVSDDRYDFAEEKEHYPLLHSGFIEVCSQDLSKSAFFLSIWFANGSYRGILLDREGHEKAFFDAGRLVDVFAFLQEGLDKLTLDWQQDKKQHTNQNGR